MKSIATRSRAFPDPDLSSGGDAFEGVEVASPVGLDDVGSQVSDQRSISSDRWMTRDQELIVDGGFGSVWL